MHQTPLAATHRALGARMVPFAGWEMPVQYSGIIQEHQAVRQAAGLFDLSHMGELWVSGRNAGWALDAALVTTPSKLAVGRAHYSMIADETGAILDDLIVYRVADNRFMVVANAANTDVVRDELRSRVAAFDAAFEDGSMRTALIALQGPLSAGILQELTDARLDTLRYYAIMDGTVAGIPVQIARTGYTGEDGFELFVLWDDAVPLWDALLEAGKARGVIPCGLGARDTLRLEAGMPLYGQELSREISPFEAGLGRVVKFEKDVDFVGRPGLEEARDAASRKLVGLRLNGRGIARTGYPVYLPGGSEPAGTVTSGTSSPTVGAAIAMAYLPAGAAEVGAAVEVGIRNDRVAAEIVPLPFYKRST